jgi:hypothetical protein
MHILLLYFFFTLLIVVIGMIEKQIAVGVGVTEALKERRVKHRTPPQRITHTFRPSERQKEAPEISFLRSNVCRENTVFLFVFLFFCYVPLSVEKNIPGHIFSRLYIVNIVVFSVVFSSSSPSSSLPSSRWWSHNGLILLYGHPFCWLISVTRPYTTANERTNEGTTAAKGSTKTNQPRSHPTGVMQSIKTTYQLLSIITPCLDQKTKKNFYRQSKRGTRLWSTH